MRFVLFITLFTHLMAQGIDKELNRELAYFNISSSAKAIKEVSFFYIDKEGEARLIDFKIDHIIDKPYFKLTQSINDKDRVIFDQYLPNGDHIEYIKLYMNTQRDYIERRITINQKIDAEKKLYIIAQNRPHQSSLVNILNPSTPQPQNVEQPAKNSETIKSPERLKNTQIIKSPETLKKIETPQKPLKSLPTPPPTKPSSSGYKQLSEHYFYPDNKGVVEVLQQDKAIYIGFKWSEGLTLKKETQLGFDDNKDKTRYILSFSVDNAINMKNFSQKSIPIMKDISIRWANSSERQHPLRVVIEYATTYKIILDTTLKDFNRVITLTY